MNRTAFLIVCTLTGWLTACTSVKQLALLQDVQQQYTLPEQPEFVLTEGDAVHISLSSRNTDAVSAFYADGHDFLIEADGTIQMPILGRLTLSGKTLKQTEQMLYDAVSPYINDLIVHVRLTNGIVTMLGAVRTQQKMTLTHPITLLEAIASCGGLTSNAKRDNILIERKENGQIKHYRVNLLSDEIFTSPCYYLIKGDVVYVSPLYPQKRY